MMPVSDFAGVICFRTILKIFLMNFNCNKGFTLVNFVISMEVFSIEFGFFIDTIFSSSVYFLV